MKFEKSVLIALVAGTLFGWITMGLFWWARAPQQGAGEKGKQAGAITLRWEDAAGTPVPSLPRGTSIDDPRISFRQLDRLAEEVALRDPVSAVRAAADIPGYDNREKYFGTVLRTWGETDGKSAAEFALQEYTGEKLTDALYYVADGWAESDPEAAGNWFLENTDGVVLEDAAWEVLEAWGRKEPRAALEWSESLDEFTRSTVLFGLAEGWGAVDPAAAAEAGMALPGNLRYEFLTSVATQWAGSDPEGLGAWATSLLSEELRFGVLSEMGLSWARMAPEAAAAWSRTVDDPGNRRFLQEGIAIGWSEHDPAGAVEWALSEVTDPEMLNEMVGDIVFNWTNLDPAGTANWLESRPPGPEKDSVLQLFSDSIAGDNPYAAAAWANEISEPELRESMLRDILADWIEAEGPDALEEARQLGVPGNLLQELETR